jgi:hypothetical protein
MYRVWKKLKDRTRIIKILSFIEKINVRYDLSKITKKTRQI